MKKTYMQKTAEVKRQWHLIDAKDQILGKVATDIATKLIGKHKVTYTPHVDAGDYVVVINARHVAVSGTKQLNKTYYSHSMFPGGLRADKLGDVLEKHPERLIEKAVTNMLPKNRLRALRMNRLKIYPDNEHKHTSQLASK